jgi:CAAX prenyl protease-like protein
MRAPARMSSPAFYRIAPFATFIAFVAVEAWLPHSPFRDSADWRWLTIARGLVVGALLVAFWRHYTELLGKADPLPGPLPREREKSAPSPLGEGRDEGHYLLAITTGLAVFAIWITFDHGWAVIGWEGRGFEPLKSDGSIDWLMAGLRLLGFALVVPVMEELFWRSFLMRWIDRKDFLALDPRAVSWKALAITAVLFASEHSLWFAGLIAGFVYNGVYKKTGSLRAPIVSHAITNGTLGLWILATGNWRHW